jgi:hypothetical protein
VSFSVVLRCNMCCVVLHDTAVYCADSFCVALCCLVECFVLFVLAPNDALFSNEYREIASMSLLALTPPPQARTVRCGH